MADIYAFIRKMTGHELVTPQDAKALTAAVDNLIDEITEKQKRINALIIERDAVKAEYAKFVKQHEKEVASLSASIPAGLDAVDMDMIQRGDRLGPELGARVASALTHPAPTHEDGSGEAADPEECERTAAFWGAEATKAMLQGDGDEAKRCLARSKRHALNAVRIRAIASGGKP